MSLKITSSSSNSLTDRPNETQNNNTHQEEIITPEQREIQILQAINTSSNDDDNDTPARGNNQTIRHSTNQSRATNKNTRNNYKTTPRNTTENPRHPEQNQETKMSAGQAKNIAEWKALFNKAREQLPKPQEQTKTTKHSGIQPTIMPIYGNEPFGDNVDKIPEENNFRIYFQNVNGLEKGTRKWEDMLQEMKTRQVSVCGFAKTNTEWHAKKTTSRLKAKLRSIAGQATMSTSTTNLKFKSIYKPGGTATIALQNWSGRVTKTITNNSGQGRWSGFQLRTKTRQLIVLTVYRVPQKSIKQVGYKTTYAQQWVIQ